MKGERRGEAYARKTSQLDRTRHYTDGLSRDVEQTLAIKQERSFDFLFPDT